MHNTEFGDIEFDFFDAVIYSGFGFVTGPCPGDVKYVLVRIRGLCYIFGINISDVEALLSRQTRKQGGYKI